MSTNNTQNTSSAPPLNPPTAQENSPQSSTQLSVEDLEFKAKTGFTPIPEAQLKPWMKKLLEELNKQTPETLPETP